MTYIYETLSISAIAGAFSNDDNASWHGNWAACEALAEYLEQYAESVGEPMELDIVAIRCDFSLYVNLDELNKEYDSEFETLDELEGYATVIRIPNSDEFITDYAG